MSSTDSSKSETIVEKNEVIVVHEVDNEPCVGVLIGQCKWWSDKLGYGFITVQQGDMKGKDIFVHHTGIRPLNSNYRTLKKGEYINFDVIKGDNGLQATNVTGIGGGSLICDVNPYIKPTGTAAVVGAPPPPPGIIHVAGHGPHYRPYAPRQTRIAIDGNVGARKKARSPFTSKNFPAGNHAST